ncbi:MAG: hypothetical protein PWQ44_1075 [Methanolobus sp.]|nr:hypothetical protein [Methanolobus sp.]
MGNSSHDKYKPIDMESISCDIIHSYIPDIINKLEQIFNVIPFKFTHSMVWRSIQFNDFIDLNTSFHVPVHVNKNHSNIIIFHFFSKILFYVI